MIRVDGLNADRRLQTTKAQHIRYLVPLRRCNVEEVLVEAFRQTAGRAIGSDPPAHARTTWMGGEGRHVSTPGTVGLARWQTRADSRHRLLTLGASLGSDDSRCLCVLTPLHGEGAVNGRLFRTAARRPLPPWDHQAPGRHTRPPLEAMTGGNGLSGSRCLASSVAVSTTLQRTPVCRDLAVDRDAHASWTTRRSRTRRRSLRCPARYLGHDASWASSRRSPSALELDGVSSRSPGRTRGTPTTPRPIALVNRLGGRRVVAARDRPYSTRLQQQVVDCSDRQWHKRLVRPQ